MDLKTKNLRRSRVSEWPRVASPPPNLGGVGGGIFYFKSELTHLASPNLGEELRTQS